MNYDMLEPDMLPVQQASFSAKKSSNNFNNFYIEGASSSHEENQSINNQASINRTVDNCRNPSKHRNYLSAVAVATEPSH